MQGHARSDSSSELTLRDTNALAGGERGGDVFASIVSAVLHSDLPSSSKGSRVEENILHVSRSPNKAVSGRISSKLDSMRVLVTYMGSETSTLGNSSPGGAPMAPSMRVAPDMWAGL